MMSKLLSNRYRSVNLTGANKRCSMCGNVIEIRGLEDQTDGRYYCNACAEVVLYWETPEADNKEKP